MKYLFYVILYIICILIGFQGAEKLLTYITPNPTTNETSFMFLIYLLATMIGFLSIAIITIKKLKK